MKMEKSITFVEKNLKINISKIKKYLEVRDDCHYTWEYRGAVQSICSLKYCVPKKILLVFYNGSNYDYHFIIKELTEKFKNQFICLGEKTEKCIAFTVSIEKNVTRINENGEKSIKNIYQTLQCIDSTIFMASSLSNCVRCP